MAWEGDPLIRVSPVDAPFTEGVPESPPTGLAPFAVPWLVPSLGQSGVFALFTALVLLTAAFVFALAEETKGRSLEELGEGRVATAS